MSLTFHIYLFDGFISRTVSLGTKSRSINRVHLWQNLFNIEALSKRLYDLSSCSSSNKYCIHTLYNIMVLLIHTIYTHEYPAHNNPYYHCIIASIHLHRTRFTFVMLKIIYIIFSYPNTTNYLDFLTNIFIFCFKCF